MKQTPVKPIAQERCTVSNIPPTITQIPKYRIKVEKNYRTANPKNSSEQRFKHASHEAKAIHDPKHESLDPITSFLHDSFKNHSKTPTKLHHSST